MRGKERGREGRREGRKEGRREGGKEKGKEGGYLQGVDECEVVEGDVIVVVLDVTECLLVVLHQCIDLAILTLCIYDNTGIKCQLSTPALRLQYQGRCTDTHHVPHLFYFMDLRLPPQLQLISQTLHLMLVLRLELCRNRQTVHL